jgi:glycosyltransferase involved in cell wall biosynthesis
MTARMTFSEGTHAPQKASPRLSVIIPTFNRAPILTKCLEALSHQTCEGSLYEIVVADDGSSDETRAIVLQFAARGSREIRYLHQENAGANAARNRAIRLARGAILLLINDDTIATQHMLTQHLAVHDRYPDDRVAVLGRVTVSPSLPPSRLAPLHLDFAFDSLGDRTELDWRAFFTCNISVKKSLLDRGGVFEERLRYYEDLELAERLSHHGLRVIYCPEALGYHDHFLNEEELFAIAAREAKALAVWARKAPQLRQVLGPLGFEPGLPAGLRLRRQLVRLVVNKATIPFWRRIARHCPLRFNALSLKIYSQIYQSARRWNLDRELRTA